MHVIPETVALPPGAFLLGSPDDERHRLDVEGPQQPIAIERPFGMGKFAVTVDQFAAFVADARHPVAATCNEWGDAVLMERTGSFRSPGFAQTGAHPAVCVSWDDAQAYLGWLAACTGRRFRLPTEAEWEYAARAGTTTPYWCGTSISRDQANCRPDDDDRGSVWRQATVPVASYAPNPWGLYEMHGNVWEWVEDCYQPSHVGAAPDGSARQGSAAAKRVLRGASWRNRARGLRSARRHAAERTYCRSDVGFRVAETI
jgi:formylglycine-generating enzyme required for sulfatase activity